MSIRSENAFAFGFDAFELAAPHSPSERAEDHERQSDRQWNEDEEDVHESPDEQNVQYFEYLITALWQVMRRVGRQRPAARRLRNPDQAGAPE